MVVSLEYSGVPSDVPNYRMNIRSTGQEFNIMRNNPGRSIESSTDHSSLRYLVYICHNRAHWLMHLLYKQLLMH